MVLYNVLRFSDVSMPWFFHFVVGEQILSYFQERFIHEMDATSVVHSLISEDIISHAVLEQVKSASSWTYQNEILYAHLKRTCTKESLVTFCHKVIAVQGNPRMKAFGKGMLSKLEGECYRVYICDCLSDCMTQTQTCTHANYSCAWQARSSWHIYSFHMEIRIHTKSLTTCYYHTNFNVRFTYMQSYI